MAVSPSRVTPNLTSEAAPPAAMPKGVDPDVEKPQVQTCVQRYLVPIVFTIFVLMRALDRVFINRVAKIMGNDFNTLMSLYWPICIQVMTAILCGGYVLRKRYLGDLSYGLGWFSPITPLASAQGRVPLYTMAIFSVFDQLNAAMTAIPQTYIPPAMQTALNNTVVLFTAVIAYFYLGSRFKQVHYAGCVLVLLACVTGSVVELEQGKLPPPQSNGKAVYVATGTMAIMYIIFLVAQVPAGMSNCYKQKVMKRVDMDLMWATFWSGNFQVLWGILFYTINWIPYPIPGGHNEKSPATLGSDLSDAWKCFLGTNPSPDVTSCSEDSAWLWFVVYLIFNISFNVLMLWLTKYLSATWASIGNVLCGDLYGVFGQFSFVSGKGSKVMPLEQWLALSYSSVAMWVYNVEDEVDKDGQSVYGIPQDADKTEAPKMAFADKTETPKMVEVEV